MGRATQRVPNGEGSESAARRCATSCWLVEKVGVRGGRRRCAKRAEDQTRGCGAPGPTRKQRREAVGSPLSAVTHPHCVLGWVTQRAMTGEKSGPAPCGSDTSGAFLRHPTCFYNMPG